MSQRESDPICWQSMAVALWGGACGFLISAIMLLPVQHYLLQRSEAVQADLSWLTGFYAPPPWQSSFQKWMYLLHCACCPILAWILCRWRHRFNGKCCILSAVCSIPVVVRIYAGLFQGVVSASDFLLAALLLGLPWFNWANLAGWVNSKSSGLFRRQSGRFSSQPGSRSEISVGGDLQDNQAIRARPLTVRSVLGGLTLLALVLLVFLWPRNIPSFAKALSTESHLASFFFGPALCFLDRHKVPGLDFESHYGVGHAYVYSFFLGDTYHQALCSYLWFMFAVLCCYFLTAYAVLANWLQSARAGLLYTIVVLALSMEGLSYRWPSCWPVRFPFLFLFLGSAAQGTLLGRSWLAILAASAWAGFSFFWQTDIGVVFLVAGIVYYLALSLQERSGWLRAPLFGLGTLLTVALLMLLAFGSRTLSFNYYTRLLEPILEYNGGFGWHLLSWRFGWSYFYNLSGPLVGMATLAWCLAQFANGTAEQKRLARFLFIASAVGLLMLYKWVNRALDWIWSMNAAALVVVLLWWTHQTVLRVLAARQARFSARPRWLLGLRWPTAVGFAGFLMVLGVADVVARWLQPPYPSGYSTSLLGRLHRFTAETPTLANWLLSKVKRVAVLAPVAVPAEPADVAFLRTHTAPEESALLLSPFDWIFLAEAHRSAAFHWIPVYCTHTHSNLERTEKNLQQASVVFVQSGTLEQLKSMQPRLYDRLTLILHRDFVLADSAATLDRYVRCSPHAQTTAFPRLD